MRKFRFMAAALAAVLVLAACGNGDEGNGGAGASGGTDGSAGTGAEVEAGGGSIVVTSLWGGTEQEAFEAVPAAFTEATGIEAEYPANRTDYATVLRTRIQGGEPRSEEHAAEPH